MTGAIMAITVTVVMDVHIMGGTTATAVVATVATVATTEAGKTEHFMRC